jgi:hypothetical protein
MPMSELVIWSGSASAWVSCPADEITWLDRALLSDGRDRSLHRPPRCPGLRHVHHRWELFSRDPSHSVYVAPFAAAAPDHQAVAAAAVHLLPPAPGGLETQPVRLNAGSWLIGVGRRVLAVAVSTGAGDLDNPTVPVRADSAITYEIQRPGGQALAGKRPQADAVARVTRYFERNPQACLAMAYYYQDFIRAAVAPQVRPMDSVVVALDLNKGAVSEYKKELQRRIWNEQGHQRELGQFLLLNGLIGLDPLQRALAAAAANEAAGRTQAAQERLRYLKK